MPAYVRFSGMLFLWMFVCAPLFAQDPAYFRISTEEGLPSNEVYSILQDEEGYIWIGSDAGLSRFDGFRFTLFRSHKQRSRALTGLCRSRTGKIYSYSFTGQIFIAEGDSLREVRSLNKKISGLTAARHPKLGDVLWVTSDQGLNCLKEKNGEWEEFKEIYRSSDELSLPQTLSGTLIGGKYHYSSPFGIGVVDDQCKLSYIEYPEGFIESRFISYLVSNADRPWLFSLVGGVIYECINGKFEPRNSAFLTRELFDRKINNAKFINGRIYICSNTGLLIYDPLTDKGEVLFASMRISDVLVDRENNFWISTLSDGLLRVPDLNNRVWRIYSVSGRTVPITKVAITPGFVYGATGDGRLGCFDRRSRKWTIHDLPVQADIQMLYADDKSDLYITVLNTIYRFEEGKFIEMPGHFPPTKNIFRNEDGYYFSTSIGVHFAPEMRGIPLLKRITTSWTREICSHPLNKKQTILATNHGVLTLEKVDTGFVIDTLFFNGQQVVSITSDESSGEIFALGSDGRLVAFNSQGERLIYQFPYEISGKKIILQGNHILVATNEGVWMIERTTGELYHYSSKDGLVSDEVNTLVIEKNQVWMATARGLQKVDYPFVRDTASVLLFLRKVVYNDQAIELSSPIHIDQGKSLTLFPRVLNYRLLDELSYAYRILPHDSTWSLLPANVEEIYIPSIPGGEFTIELKAISASDQRSSASVFISGTVIPPFYQRWWFYVLIGLFTLGIAFLLFRFRIRYIRQKQIKELKRIRLEAELRLSQQTALKAQMNPHFIFNVLNSIKGFIYESDKKNAAAYLSDFSGLVRRVLDMSSSATVSLSEELDMLQIYIRLEAMLLQKDFQFGLSVDESIDQEAIQIPALLIQPFVENAFKHGLRHKEGNKELKIIVERDRDVLLIRVRDNGVGRAISSQINAESKQHRSFASESSGRRVDLLNHEQPGLVGLEIIDLHQADGSNAGTEVVIRLHINDTDGKDKGSAGG